VPSVRLSKNTINVLSRTIYAESIRHGIEDETTKSAVASIIWPAIKQLNPDAFGNRNEWLIACGADRDWETH